MNSYDYIVKVLNDHYGAFVTCTLSHNEESVFGDYATNVAFALAKHRGVSSKECATQIVQELGDALCEYVEKIEVAGPGFVNFFLKDDIRTEEIEVFANEVMFTSPQEGRVIVEYTDPNPFKLFHIGHLVPNTIGEAIARLLEATGNTVTRICYQGDVGIHVAKTLYAMVQNFEPLPEESSSLRKKVAYLGRAYAYGNTLYEEEVHKDAIVATNKAIFVRSDEQLNTFYDLGKKWSLEYFETVYKKLGTSFDYYIFESEVGESGKAIVTKHLGTVFEESDGALVYKGERVGLHTRVFVNKEGLPTYEAKELGNTYKKEALVPQSLASFVVTANEIDEYFKVIKAVLHEIDAPLADRLVHISHGFLRLPEGKMSSRTGNIIPAEELIDMVKEKLQDRVSSMKVQEEDKATLLNDVAVGAIKFSILKSAPGKDMVFDFDKSLSFEGDSGPYLQYTHARLCALLDKAEGLGITGVDGYVVEHPERSLEAILAKYPYIITKAHTEVGPHHVVQYLLQMTRLFNNLYSRVQIVDESHRDESKYYVLLALVTRNILAHGLRVLGIVAPKRM